MDIIGRIGTIARIAIIAMDTIGRTIGAMDIVRTIAAMGVRRFTSPYHQFASPSAVAATGNPGCLSPLDWHVGFKGDFRQWEHLRRIGV
jgi:hypothetical protein